MQAIHRGQYRGVEIVVWEGDILTSGAECIAVSGNSQGMMGGGISGAIKAAAGPEIERESQSYAPIARGRAIMLSPRRLAQAGTKAISYLSIMNQPIDNTNDKVINGAVLQLLQTSNDRKFESVAIPLAGAGVGRLPARVSSDAIVGAVRTYLIGNVPRTFVKKIVLSGFTRRDAAAFIQGLDHLYERPLASAALLVIDMIGPFIGDHTLIPAQDADRLSSGINTLAASFCANSLPIIYVKDVHDAGDNELLYVHPHCIGKPEAFPFHNTLNLLPTPDKAEVRIKRTYSAFFNTDLAEYLRTRGCQTVVIAGTQTHVCVKYTALHAMMHGFRVIVTEDITTSSTPERHNNGLREIEKYIGEVSQSAYVSEILSMAQ